MCNSDALTCLIKRLFQYLTKSVPYVTNLKLSLLKSLGWMKAPGRIHMHKIQSLEDYIESQNYFKHYLNTF